eukprot:m.57224 g.57224  ORF g.57224 m.57224 type:complete len:538 (-) comp13441_c0_seq1:14-1627(-)
MLHTPSHFSAIQKTGGIRLSHLLAGGNVLGDGLGLLDDLTDVADHEEGSLGLVVVLAVEDLLKAVDRLLELDHLALGVCEDLGDLEGLRQETLDLAGASHSLLLLLAQLVHTQNGNDVLEGLVVLEDLLHATGDVVVALADDVLVQNARGRVKRVDSGVDAQLGNATGQHGGGVQVGEGGGRGGIGQIVGRHEDGLHGGDRALGGGGDALLHDTHVRGEGGLVADSRGDTAEQGRHLRAGLGEAEDVVDEEEHVRLGHVAEVLGDSQTGEGDTGAGAGGLVHLAVDERDLGLALELDDTGGDHLVVEIIALAGALADAGKHGEATVALGDVVDQLHDEHRLADTGAAKEANLAALGVRGQQVDDLNARDEQLLLHAHLGKLGRLLVDGALRRRVDRAALVNGLANDVHNAAQRLLADGDLNGEAGVADTLTTHETLSAVHGNGTHGVLAEVLGDLQDEAGVAALDLEGVQNGGELAIELDVDDGTDDRHDAARLLLGGNRGGGGGGGRRKRALSGEDAQRLEAAGTESVEHSRRQNC